MHTQRFVKVNAPVDSEISKLIEALGKFPKLQTLESCQGNDIEGAWVCFVYGEYWVHSWNELCKFILDFFAPSLYDIVGDCIYLSININPSGRTQGEITIRPGHVGMVARAIEKLANAFNS